MVTQKLVNISAGKTIHLDSHGCLVTFQVGHGELYTDGLLLLWIRAKGPQMCSLFEKTIAKCFIVLSLCCSFVFSGRSIGSQQYGDFLIRLHVHYLKCFSREHCFNVLIVPCVKSALI